jgi:hypothetical protein
LVAILRRCLVRQRLEGVDQDLKETA